MTPQCQSAMKCTLRGIYAGNFSVKCEVCNEINAIRQRLTRCTKQRPLGLLAWQIAHGKAKMP